MTNPFLVLYCDRKGKTLKKQMTKRRICAIVFCRNSDPHLGPGKDKKCLQCSGIILRISKARKHLSILYQDGA